MLLPFLVCTIIIGMFAHEDVCIKLNWLALIFFYMLINLSKCYINCSSRLKMIALHLTCHLIYQFEFYVSHTCFLYQWLKSKEKKIYTFTHLISLPSFLLDFRYGVLWLLEEIMVQCLDGLKHLCAALINCCDADSSKQPTGLENPEVLARETVCMSYL